MSKSLLKKSLLSLVLVVITSNSQAAVSPETRRALQSDLANGSYQSAKSRGLDVLEQATLGQQDVPLLESLAAEYAAADMRDLAGAFLSRAAELLDAPANESERQTLMRIGASLQDLNLRSQAGQVLMRGIRITGKDKADALNASGYQTVGDLAFETGDLDEADTAYQSAMLSLQAKDYEGRARLISRQLKLASAQGDAQGGKALFSAYQSLVPQLTAIDGFAALQIQVVANALALGDQALVSPMQRLLEQAIQRSNEDAGLLIEANQLRGQMAALSGDAASALLLLRKALVDLGADATPAQTYRLYWQLARIQAENGQLETALNNYRRATVNLQTIRGELLQGSTLVFNERVLPVYQGYLELLLQIADEPGREAQALAEVQQTLEDLSAAEILDYFDDNCVLPKDVMTLASAPAGTAVLYPILLAETGALLVRTSTGLSKFNFEISNASLKSMVLAFRETITNPATTPMQYQREAEAIYKALLGPASTVIDQSTIDTLVTIPSGYLRLLPIAALHNGETFLVNRYQLATTLGLQLTEVSDGALQSGSAFVGGVSDAVQGFEALPGVETELAELSNALTTTPLLNASFSVASVSDRLGAGGDSIVHLATHGFFDGDHANSFLLAHDDKITLDRLQSTVGARRFTGNPLDLLVLSACETAKGDERAALGLAGVSLKAGAKSTVASLWPIADAATAILMKRFYEELRGGASKASALQAAQGALLSDPEWAHPAYWSPYLLIGNWG